MEETDEEKTKDKFSVLNIDSEILKIEKKNEKKNEENIVNNNSVNNVKSKNSRSNINNKLNNNTINDNNTINSNKSKINNPNKEKKENIILSDFDYFKKLKSGYKEKINDPKRHEENLDKMLNPEKSKENFLTNLLQLIEKATTIENEKFEDKILFGHIYPILDFFDNENFNMDRLENIDDIAEIKKHVKNNKLYRTLNKQEKKLYLEEFNLQKKKASEDRIKRINMLMEEGNYIKITNNNVTKKNLKKPDDHNKYEINIAKKCVVNNWSFPPIEYYDKISPTLNSEKKIDDNEEYIDINNDKLNRNLEFNLESLKEGENANVNQNINESISSASGIKRPVIDIFAKERISLRLAYLILIKNEMIRYSKDIIDKGYLNKAKGFWVNIYSFLDLFDNFVILHNPKFYNFHENIYNLRQNSEDDKFRLPDMRKVFYINTTKEKNEKFNIKSNNSFDRENYYSILINFISKLSKQKNIMEYNEKNTNIEKDILFETNISFDLLERNSNGDFVLFEENIFLSNFYESKQINYIEKEKEYILYIKGGSFPTGYNLNIYSDCFMQAYTYEEYLENFLNFTSKKFEINIDIIEGRKLFFLGKYLIKVK
jgi:hypothetical protein